MVKVSGLKHNLDPQELLCSLDLPVNIEKVIPFMKAHGNVTIFLFFVDDRYADGFIQRYHGVSFLLGSNIQVSRPTSALFELMKMYTSIFENEPQLQIQKCCSAHDAKVVSVVLKTISHLSEMM